MFGFFKRANYRSKCTEVIFKVVGGHQQQCVEFVEDHKSLFDGFGNKGVQPGTAVGLANMVIIKALADGEEAKVRDYNNCKTRLLYYDISYYQFHHILSLNHLILNIF